MPKGARIGRPPKDPGERARVVGISMTPAAIEALRELSALRGVSQGVLVGSLVQGALRRERAKHAGAAE
jgi:hypothetical protein